MLNWNLMIDVLAQAMNGPDRFVKECFDEDSYPQIGYYRRLITECDYSGIKFWKRLDIVGQELMSKWLQARYEQFAPKEEKEKPPIPLIQLMETPGVQKCGG